MTSQNWNGIMPDDVVLEIMDKLPFMDRVKVERVSTRWHQLSRQSWKRVHKVNFIPLLSQVSQRCKQCHQRSLSPRKFLNECCISCIDSTVALFNTVIHRAGPYLTHLDFGHNEMCTAGQSDYLSTQFYATIAIARCPRLIHLDLSCLQLYGEQLQALLNGNFGYKLEKLYMIYCFQSYSEFADQEAIEPMLSAFFKQLNHLKHIDLSENKILICSSLMSLNPNLKVINLSQNTRIKRRWILNNRNIFRQFAQTHHSLVELHYDRCTLFHLEKSFCYFHSSLEKLILSHYKPPRLGRIFVTLWPNLKYLDISHYRFLTTTLLNSLAQNCPSLETLNLKGTSTNWYSQDIIQYRNLSKLNLRFFDVSRHESITDADLKAVCCSGKMESLYIHMCELVSADCIMYLVESCPNLQYLQATGTSRSFDLNFLQNLSVLTNSQKDRTKPLSLEISAAPGRVLTSAACQDVCHEKLHIITIT